jgi:hypothetical protein
MLASLFDRQDARIGAIPGMGASDSATSQSHPRSGLPLCEGESGIHPAQPSGRGRARCPVGHQDFQAFEELSDVVSHPYQEQPGLERYATPARPEEGVRWTFCGT